MISTKNTTHSEHTLRVDSTHCQTVDIEEFCKLLLGFKHLARADDPATGMRGLYDEQTGITYLTDRNKLAKHTSRLVS